MKVALKTLAIFFLLSLPLHAETITLKDGTVLNGTILSQDTTSLMVQSNFGTIKIDKFNIVGINYSAPASPYSQTTLTQENRYKNNASQKPTFKWAIGLGVPYAMFGNQFGLVLGDQLEIFAAVSSLSNSNPYNYNYSYYKYVSEYDVTAYGIRYFYDTDNHAFIPGTGAYFSIYVMPYHYNYEYTYYYSWSDIYSQKYAYDLTLLGVSVGVDGKFGVFHTNIEVGYGFVLSEKLTLTSGDTPWLSKPGGLLVSTGLGLAL